MSALDHLRRRTRWLTRADVDEHGDYVLCWLMQALRAEENPVLDAAIALGNRLGRPVVVLHALENRYPYASHRLHRFLLEASRELEVGVRDRGLRFIRWVRRGEREDACSEVDIVACLAEHAAAVVVDDVPTFVTRTYADDLARRLGIALLAVDACCAVPMNAFPGPIRTTKGFRAAHEPLREKHLRTVLRQEPDVGPFEGSLAYDSLDLPPPAPRRSGDVLDAGGDAAPDGSNRDGLDAFIATCGVDMSVPPASASARRWHGGRRAALKRLRYAAEEVMGRYKWTRNNPALPDGTARLSPWMHFGVLSPREVAQAALTAEAAGDLPPASRYKFLDETLTWREYYYHRCRWEPAWSRFAGLPARAKATLRAHADDQRPALYPLDALVHGETDDETWNAAQKGFLLDGWMHNNLRMYWVKQIIKWRPLPEDAFATACYLNDRFSLDGRDACTYGGIRWGFGEARRGYRERDVYGWVSAKTDRALRKRPGAPEWLAAEAARPVPVRATLPEGLPADFDRYRAPQ